MTRFLYTVAGALLMLVAVSIPATVRADVCASYWIPNDSLERVGHTSAYTMAAQEFSATTTCYADSVSIRAGVFAGSPSDDMTVALYTQVGGYPDTLLEQCADIDVTGGYATHVSTCAGTTLIEAGEDYMVVVGRSGALDGSNNY